MTPRSILTWRHPILFIGAPWFTPPSCCPTLTARKYDILAAFIMTAISTSGSSRSLTPSHSPALLDSHSPHSSLHAHLQLERTPRRSSVGQYDTFFGLDDVVASKFSDYLVDEFGCPLKLESPRTLKIEPRLQNFIAEVVYTAGLPISVASAALILLKRLRAQMPKLTKPSGLSGHRLFLASFIIAAREQSLCYGNSQENKIFSASYWSKISMFSTREIDELTSQFFDRLEGNVTVFPSRAATLEQTGRPFVIKSYWSVAHSTSGGNARDKLRGSMLSGGPTKRKRSIKAVITSFFLSRRSS